MDRIITREEQDDIKELVSILLCLAKEDRIILMSNANALKTRKELEKEDQTPA